MGDETQPGNVEEPAESPEAPAAPESDQSTNDGGDRVEGDKIVNEQPTDDGSESGSED